MLSNIFLSIIIGIILYLIICQIIKLNIEEFNVQESILIMYFFSIFTLFLYYKIERNEIKNGLLLTSLFLIFNSLFANWNNMSNKTKLILLTFNFCLIIIYTYLPKNNKFKNIISNFNKNKYDDNNNNDDKNDDDNDNDDNDNDNDNDDNDNDNDNDNYNNNNNNNNNNNDEELLNDNNTTEDTN